MSGKNFLPNNSTISSVAAAGEMREDNCVFLVLLQTFFRDDMRLEAEGDSKRDSENIGRGGTQRRPAFAVVRRAEFLARAGFAVTGTIETDRAFSIISQSQTVATRLSGYEIFSGAFNDFGNDSCGS